MKLPNVVSETVKKLNPSLFGVAGLSDPKREPVQRRQSQDRQLDQGAESVGYRITIVSLRRHRIDAHDNLPQGCKPLVDCITASLGFASDDDPRLEWEYAQCLSRSQGTIVKIERR